MGDLICLMWGKLGNDNCFFAPQKDPENKLPVFSTLKNALEKLGHKLIVASRYEDIDHADYVITFNYPFDPVLEEKLKKLPSQKVILFQWEPPVAQPKAYEKQNHLHFLKVLTWKDDLVDGKKYYKFFYPDLRSPIRSDLIPFEDRKLCALVMRNLKSNHENELYTERRKVISFFEKNHPNDFNFYGEGWPWWTKYFYKTFRGKVERKLEIINRYKFYICYENSRDIPGYITEKIFDCFYCGCIPIYWGANNIENYIPRECFIDRKLFNNEHDLYDFLKNMRKETYLNYLHHISEFLLSDQAKLYSADNFVKTFVSVLYHK